MIYGIKKSQTQIQFFKYNILAITITIPNPKTITESTSSPMEPSPIKQIRSQPSPWTISHFKTIPRARNTMSVDPIMLESHPQQQQLLPIPPSPKTEIFTFSYLKPFFFSLLLCRFNVFFWDGSIRSHRRMSDHTGCSKIRDSWPNNCDQIDMISFMETMFLRPWPCLGRCRWIIQKLFRQYD